MKPLPPRYTYGKCFACGQSVDRINPDWLRAVRSASGLSLREMARQLGRSAPYISDVELGRRNATKNILHAYEKLYR